MTEIASASVEVLTSTSLLPLRDMIAKAREQQSQVKSDPNEACDDEVRQQGELKRRKTPTIPDLDWSFAVVANLVWLSFARRCLLSGQSGHLTEVLERLLVLEPKEDMVSSCNGRSCK